MYTTLAVVAQRAQFVRALRPQPGERIVDVGAGTGFLDESIAEQVGLSGFVAGRDIAPVEVQAWAQDLRRFGAQGQYFFSLNRDLFLASKPAA